MLGLLNISEAMSIALHACVTLAEAPERYYSVHLVSEKLGFSTHHSAKVAQMLVRAGILKTERGPAGGGKLARSPREITLLEIYEAVGGRTRLKGCLLKPEICKGNCCVLGKIIAKENERLFKLLRSITLDTVVRSLKRNRAKSE